MPFVAARRDVDAVDRQRVRDEHVVEPLLRPGGGIREPGRRAGRGVLGDPPGVGQAGGLERRQRRRLVGRIEVTDHECDHVVVTVPAHLAGHDLSLLRPFAVRLVRRQVRVHDADRAMRTTEHRALHDAAAVAPRSGVRVEHGARVQRQRVRRQHRHAFGEPGQRTIREMLQGPVMVPAQTGRQLRRLPPADLLDPDHVGMGGEDAPCDLVEIGTTGATQVPRHHPELDHPLQSGRIREG